MSKFSVKEMEELKPGAMVTFIGSPVPVNLAHCALVQLLANPRPEHYRSDVVCLVGRTRSLHQIYTDVNIYLNGFTERNSSRGKEIVAKNGWRLARAESGVDGGIYFTVAPSIHFRYLNKSRFDLTLVAYNVNRTDHNARGQLANSDLVVDHIYNSGKVLIIPNQANFSDISKDYIVNSSDLHCKRTTNE